MKPDDFAEYRQRVFSMLYNPRYDARAVFAAHLQITGQFEEPLRSRGISHTNDKKTSRRLKIGYVSPDFRRHSLAYFIEPVLSSRTRTHFEIFCYSLISPEDEVAARIKSHADHRKNIADMKEDQTAEVIRNDGIDILIDLAGHMYASMLRVSILRRIPDSFLVLKPSSFADWKISQNVKGMLSKHGIDSGQLELIPFRPYFSEHIRTYNDIDISLDPFPYNGVTTTCESLWMGVPVITLEGTTHISHVESAFSQTPGSVNLSQKHLMNTGRLR